MVAKSVETSEMVAMIYAMDYRGVVRVDRVHDVRVEMVHD